ncbi:MAG TPA: L-seryl-tRNA(Sec) selenium transferase, partial [Caldimonas sp.]
MSGAQAGRAPHLPAVDRVLGWPAVAALTAAHGRVAVLAAVRAELAALRALRSGGAGPALPIGLTEANEAVLACAITARVEAARAPSLRKVFNLTGTVLHTNLGRAPLPPQALAAIEAAAAGATNLEFDLMTGRRGERDDHVEAALRRITGAAAASVVNN